MVSTVHSAPLSSVRTFLDRLFDYAGLFPPASLSLHEAAREYDAYRRGPDAWMLGPFVVPVKDLPALESFEFLLDRALPLCLDVLPASAFRADDLSKSLAIDLLAVHRFLARHSGAAQFVSMELRFPAEDLSSIPRARHASHAVTAAALEADSPPDYTYLELVRTESYDQDVRTYFEALSTTDIGALVPGAKLRCGGMAPTAYPSPQEIALFIHEAVRTNHPFKATAGLHHPVRHLNEGAGAWMHGFLNVFFASVLARSHQLDLASIAAILEETEAEAFVFDSAGIAWRGCRATTTDLAEGRSTLARSIGSCSFDQPRHDLAALGWLQESKA